MPEMLNTAIQWVKDCMGILFHKNKKVIVPVFDFAIEQGVIYVSTGNDSIEVCTKIPPTQVWISFDGDCNSIPVCGGDIDRVGYTITPTGFVLQTNIVSRHRTIVWIAVVC